MGAATPTWPTSNCRTGGSLNAQHPGAAASLREGLEDTLTVKALSITGALYRTLRTTNPIENLNGSIAHFTRNVKRWKDGQMTLRWIAGALSDAKGRFRKLRGHRDMKTLLAALKAKSASVAEANARPRSITNEEPSSGRVQQASGHRLGRVGREVTPQEVGDGLQFAHAAAYVRAGAAGFRASRGAVVVRYFRP